MKINKILLLIFLAAFLIRLIALNQSLWLDEATTANVVQKYGFTQIINEFSRNDFHPPLYYLLMKLWTDVFGYSEVALRFPSIIFSLLTGYFVYKIAKLLNSYIVGVYALVFFLFNPLIVYYSQEARMYMMVTMFLTAALYFFLKRKWILFGIFGVLGLLTFYGSIFLVAAFLFYFFYKKQYKYLFISLLVLLGYFLIISPLLYQQIVNAKVSLTNVTNWSYVLGKANLKNLLLIPVKFSIGRISFEPKWLYYGIAGGWVSYVLWVLFGNLKSKTLFVYLLIFPLFLGFIISFATPLLQYFRFIYLIPIMAIILAKNRLGRWGLLGGFFAFSMVYLLLPQFHREDWRGLVKSLPKDKPVYMIVSSSDPLKYYKQNSSIIELKSLSSSSSLSREITVIPYAAEIYGFDYQKLLQEKNYKLTSKKSFRGLELEYWSIR